MPVRLVNIMEAIQLLPELIEAASKGEPVFIVNEQQHAIAQLVPITSDVVEYMHPERKLGAGKGLFRMADDFDASLDDFADYQ